MKLICLQCGHEFEGTISYDEFGWHSSCPECESSFDVDAPENTVLITVYADTVPGHEEEDDFLEICVSRELAEKYFEETQDKDCTRGNINKDHYDCFDDWNDDYICDDTLDFYAYAADRNGILGIK